MKGHEIRALRTRLGLTQKALADKVEVSSNTVARWERDELGVSAGMVDRLLAVAESLPSGAAVSRMIGFALDPHHRAILDGLNDRLDPEVFEQCAVGLLQAEWRGLVPVRGGQDEGFDGAVADGESQEPFPLVVTTGKRLVWNLGSSLDSAQRKGWAPQRVLFATSQRITPALRRKLHSAARDRRVRLAQTYDQDWFADRLYREPEWCKRLLGVTGRPHALSVFPLSRRPPLGDDVLGREREKQWLLDHRGDCLLAGQPGSGKTFLLRALALEGKALFMVAEDREQLANDVRSLEPEAVIVDDAHAHPTFIATLVQLRSEIHAGFRIIATCWPGNAEQVMADLQVGRASLLTLDLVDADTMIEIIRSAGIQGPNRLLYAIRSQAAGRPGLAATLVHLCLAGDIGAATTGEGLVDAVASDLDRVLEVDSMTLLAPFALGGDAGVRQEDVAERLNESLLETRKALAMLGAAGIVRDRSGCISVEPPPMRWVLVRRVFFGGPGSLSVERFMPIVRNRANALDTLIGARSRGADVRELEGLLEEAGSERLWANYAWVGPDAAGFVLRRHPELINALAEPALVNRPKTAIPMLLSGAEEECTGGTTLDSALEPLERWIRSGNARWRREAIGRRETLVQCTEAWWRQSGNSRVSVAAMCLALNPDFDSVTQDPGGGTHITFSKAMLDASVIRSLAACWPAMMTVVEVGSDPPWTNLLDLLTKWCHPRVSAEEEAEEAAIQFLSRMLHDVALASRGLPGVQHRIAAIGKRVGVAVETELDSEFECLFPPDPYDSEDLDAEVERFDQNVRQFAEGWTSRTAGQLASFLDRQETEARRAGITHVRLTPLFCRAIAEACSDPGIAVRTLVRARLPADLVESFLGKAVSVDRSAWLIVSDCLDDDLYTAIGMQLAVCHDAAPPKILRSALTKVRDVPRLLEHYCVIGEISRHALSEALSSQDASTAVEAAIGHWKGPGRSRTEGPLDKLWRRAFLLSAEVTLSSLDGYWTGEILTRDGELAVEWLIRCLAAERAAIGFHTQEAARSVVASLDSAQRTRVLSAHDPNEEVFGIAEVVQALVGRDPEVYGLLLTLKKLESHHLSPLQGDPSGSWRSMAVLALDHGYSCEEIVDANLGGSWSWQGNLSEMWAERRRHFEKLQHDDDARIGEIGRLGVGEVSGMESSAKDREREEAIYGLS